MRSPSRLSMCLLSWMILTAGSCAPALADWDPGDGHKMHFPQLPDPNGWDIRVSNARRDPGDPFQWIVADDWRCSETGPVSGVHFWVSFDDDFITPIENLHLSIHSDIPDPDGADPLFSMPGDLLWERNFNPQQFTFRAEDSWTGSQGWYDPVFDEWNRPDHQNYYQINVTDIENPFIQEEGTIYWLDIAVDLELEGEGGRLGWKTTLDHWNDDAVYWDPIAEVWRELRDPSVLEDPPSLDMAFVIVPEPQGWVLFGFGFIGVVLVARRKVLQST